MNTEAKTFWKNAYDAELARGLPAVACAKEATLAVMEATAAGFLADDPMPESNDMKPHERHEDCPPASEGQRVCEVSALASWLLNAPVVLNSLGWTASHVITTDAHALAILNMFGLARKSTPKATDEGHGVSGVEASAIGDVVKVPPHWHVRLEAFVAVSMPEGGLIGQEIDLPTCDGWCRVLVVSAWRPKDDAGIVLVDVVSPFRPNASLLAEFTIAGPGVERQARIISP